MEGVLEAQDLVRHPRLRLPQRRASDRALVGLGPELARKTRSSPLKPARRSASCGMGRLK